VIATQGLWPRRAAARAGGVGHGIRYEPAVVSYFSDCSAEVVGIVLSRTNHEAFLLVIEQLFGWVSDSKPLVVA
jgi:hypothetical protein